MSRLRLIKSLVNKLSSDSVLISLTGHDEASNKIRIARDSPPVKGKVPFLGVKVFASAPMLESDVTQLQVSRIHFLCHGDEIRASQIADRVEHLFHDVSGNANTGYYDFSGPGLSIRSSRFKRRRGASYDQNTDVWTELIEADIIWTPESC